MNDEMDQAQDSVIGLPSDVESQLVPEPVVPPMEVISVDELLDRLAPEEPAEIAEPVDALDDIPVVEPDPVIGLVEGVVEHLLDMIVDLGKIEEHTNEIKKNTNEISINLETVVQTLDHPALTTSFADYTVTEALLLLLLLFAFVSACARMLRGGFQWLRS